MKRIAFLDYVRVFACFLVMLVHASENFTEPPALRTWQDRSLSFRMRPIGCGYQFMMASPVCLCLCS